MKFEFNLPNILTLSRIFMMPLIFFFLLQPVSKNTLVYLLIAFILLVITEITDALDGYIARKYNLCSEFGAYMDPLADKILIWGLYIVFMFINGLMINPIFVLIIILRDVFITLLRNYCLKKEIKFKTSFVAKAKTASQMVVATVIIIYMIVSRFIDSNYLLTYKEIWLKREGFIKGLYYLPNVLTGIVAIFTLYTGIDYYFSFLKAKKEKEGVK